jgi:triosephosphate isomerase
MRRPLIVGNWKMNGTKESARHVLDGIAEGFGQLSRCEVAVCPPFPFLPMAEEVLSGTPVRVGAQNLSTEDGGAFTGEVSAGMLVEFGCRYVICGHSERRRLFGEDSVVIAKKLAAAHAKGLRPILCVGETLQEREHGDADTTIASQLDGIIDLCGIDAFGAIEVAYEPLWAIGTDKSATPAQAQHMHAFIRQRLAAHRTAIAERIRILYGGSMNPDDAPELLRQADIDGGLIGRASLNPRDFLAIANAAEQIGDGTVAPEVLNKPTRSA